MRILVNEKIKNLFMQISLCTVGFLLFFAAFLGSEMRGTALPMQETGTAIRTMAIVVPVCILCMGIQAITISYRIFK